MAVFLRPQPPHKRRVVLAIFMTLIVISVIYFSELPLLNPARPHLNPIRWLLLSHGLLAATAFIICPLQFSSYLRKTRLKLHHTLGKIYVISIYLSAVFVFANLSADDFAYILFGLTALALFIPDIMLQWKALFGKKISIKRGAHIVAVLLLGLGLSSCCHSAAGLNSQEGRLQVKGGKIWYKVISDPKTAGKPPLLLLHGGPGFPSYYLSPLFTLATERPVIVFDQLGCGRSDRTTDTTTMSIASHISQVESLLAHLGVKDFYLYGHSYGTMLAVEYYFKHPQQVKAIILGSPCMSTQRWVTDADTLMASLREPERTVLRNMKKGIKADSLTEAKALDLYFASFYNHRQHIPRVDSAIAQSGNELYSHMWGQSEFIADGTLANYNRINDIKRITVPALLIAGEYDAARPATVRYYASLMPHAKFVLVKGAGHSTMNDMPGVDEKAIHRFLLAN